jgi:hypothetical protein
MSSKRRDTLDLAINLESPKEPSKQNAFPRVLDGQPLQQLKLPRKLLSALPEKHSSASKTVKASNLAEVRAKLKAGKLKLG